MKHRAIYIDLYESHVFIFWDCKPIEGHRYITKNLRGLAEHIPAWFANNNERPPKGVCVSEFGQSANCVIWLSKPTPTLISHEVMHAGFDLLVVGYMGHSALYNRFIGGTTDRLVEHAPCNVLVIK
jgi:hypothetical protein